MTSLLRSKLGAESEFRHIADQICAIADKYQVKIRGYHSSELPHFRALPQARQETVLLRLKAFLGSMEVTESMGERLDSQKRALWCGLSALGLVPPSELFSRIDDNSEIIEIYNLEGFQVWRNFNYFDVCSYTLEEIYSIDWNDLYLRSDEKTEECRQKITALLTGQTPDLFDANVENHEITELCSQYRFVVEARHGILCRLKDKGGQLAAWVVVSKGRVLRKVEFHQPPHLEILR